MRALTVSLILSLFCTLSFAAAPAPNEPFREYYLIKEQAIPDRRGFGFENPIQLAALREKIAAYIDLSNFVFFNQPFPQSPEPYNRDRHFSGWINDPRDPNCYDTRAKVLIRDSKRPVTFKASNPCVVEAGEWHEPYVPAVHGSSSQVQIDHVVALKNAYISGAWRWDWPHRCLYSNYIGNDFHLITSDGPANMAKGDKSPADWMPQNRGGHCAHLGRWLAIKLIWGLAMHQREATAIQTMLRQAGCNPQDFRLPVDFLTQQRQLIAANLNLCAGRNPPR